MGLPKHHLTLTILQFMLIERHPLVRFYCVRSPGLHVYSRRNVLKTETIQIHPSDFFHSIITRTRNICSALTLVFEHFKDVMLTGTRFQCSVAILNTASKQWLFPYSHPHKCQSFKIVFASSHMLASKILPPISNIQGDLLIGT